MEHPIRLRGFEEKQRGGIGRALWGFVVLKSLIYKENQISPTAWYNQPTRSGLCHVTYQHTEAGMPCNLSARRGCEMGGARWEILLHLLQKKTRQLQSDPFSSWKTRRRQRHCCLSMWERKKAVFLSPWQTTWEYDLKGTRFILAHGWFRFCGPEVRLSIMGMGWGSHMVVQGCLPHRRPEVEKGLRHRSLDRVDIFLQNTSLHLLTRLYLQITPLLNSILTFWISGRENFEWRTSQDLPTSHLPFWVLLAQRTMFSVGEFLGRRNLCANVDRNQHISFPWREWNLSLYCIYDNIISLDFYQ